MATTRNRGKKQVRSKRAIPDLPARRKGQTVKGGSAGAGLAIGAGSFAAPGGSASTASGGGLSSASSA